MLDTSGHHFIFLHAHKGPSDIIILDLELAVILSSSLIPKSKAFLFASCTDFIPFIKQVGRLTVTLWMELLRQWGRSTLFHFSDNTHRLHEF